jgi:CRP-like cAMP-binding protein
MLVELLSVTGPFAGLPAELLHHIAAHCAELRLPSGRTLFSHGDPADAAFLVLDGTVTLYRDQVGRPLQLLARLGSGDLVGEHCLFDEERRSSTARVGTACRLLRFERGPLRSLLLAEPHLALRVQNAAARRRNLNAAAALQLGQQSEVRIRLRAAARLNLGDGSVLAVEIENLSVGGVSLSGAPRDWVPGTMVRFALLADEEPLPAQGRVAWRDGSTVGIAFLDPHPSHERHVYRLLRKLGESG